MSIPRGLRGVVCVWAGLAAVGCGNGTVQNGSGSAGSAMTTGAAGSTGPAGTSGSAGSHGAFGTCKESAQDECPGWGSVDSIAGGTKSCLDQMWAEGPGTDFSTHGHYINMSNPKYKMVACGYTMTAAGKIWAAQDFK
jgi:hypothetical protein